MYRFPAAFFCRRPDAVPEGVAVQDPELGVGVRGDGGGARRVEEQSELPEGLGLQRRWLRSVDLRGER